MSLIYVTGAPGAGKSTLQKALSQRGLEALDLDGSGLGGPHNKQSGARTVVPPADQRTPEWFDAHEWRIDLSAIEALSQRAQDKDVFLCGVAASDGEMLHYFSKILYLALDDKTLKERILARQGNDYGKNDFELKEILERKRKLDAKYAGLDVIEIDASRTVDEVADDIVSKAGMIYR